MHIEHIAGLVGVEHVGLGSDFDGVFSFPGDLQDVSCYPNLIAALMKRGFSSVHIDMICGANFLRLWDSIQSSASL